MTTKPSDHPVEGQPPTRKQYSKNGYWICCCGVIAMPLTDDTECDCGDIYLQEWNFVEVPTQSAPIEEEQPMTDEQKFVQELEGKGIHGEQQKPFLEMHAKLRAKLSPQPPQEAEAIVDEMIDNLRHNVAAERERRSVSPQPPPRECTEASVEARWAFGEAKRAVGFAVSNGLIGHYWHDDKGHAHYIGPYILSVSPPLPSEREHGSTVVDSIVSRANDYREMARKSRLDDNYSAADSLDGKASGLFVAANMVRAAQPSQPSLSTKGHDGGKHGISWSGSEQPEMEQPAVCDDPLCFGDRHPVRQPSPAAKLSPEMEPANGLSKVIGAWSGDETDAELLSALDEIRKPSLSPEMEQLVGGLRKLNGRGVLLYSSEVKILLDHFEGKGRS